MNLDTKKEYKFWAHQEWWEQLGPEEEVDIIEEALNNRKIRIHTGEDILCWGFKPKGSFTIKEDYNLWMG